MIFLFVQGRPCGSISKANRVDAPRCIGARRRQQVAHHVYRKVPEPA